MNSSEHTDEQEMDDDHYDHVDHDHLIFRDFKLWNQLSSTVLLIFVMILGLFANIFVCYCIYKKTIGTKYVNSVLLALSLKNILATTTCVPQAIVMLNFPSTIERLSCDVQENITFVVLFAGYLFPMLLSIVQCDHVVRPQQHLIGGKRVVVVVFIVTIISITLGVQSKLTTDKHGCHLWSIVTDTVVLTYIYSIATVVFVTLVVMVTCYMMIYFQARASQEAVISSTQKAANTSRENSTAAFQRTPQQQQQHQQVTKRIAPFKSKMTTAILKPMFFIVISNILTSFPWIILYVFTVYDHIENSTNYAEIRILTMSIIYLPIAMDPVIFIAFSTKGRRAIMAIVQRNQPTVTPYPTTAIVFRTGHTNNSAGLSGN